MSGQPLLRRKLSFLPVEKPAPRMADKEGEPCEALVKFKPGLRRPGGSEYR